MMREANPETQVPSTKATQAQREARVEDVSSRSLGRHILRASKKRRHLSQEGPWLTRKPHHYHQGAEKAATNLEQKKRQVPLIFFNSK
jgi:hypothetical protein